jgi:hypothetical protein
VAAKAAEADCLLVAAARAEAVAVASVMAPVLPVVLAYAKDDATAGGQGVDMCTDRSFADQNTQTTKHITLLTWPACTHDS